MHKFMQYEVSLSVWAVPKWLSFKNYRSESQKNLMCIYEGHRCICVPNMKFVCLTLLLGEVCTDNANADANTDDDNARWTKHDCIRLFG